MTGNKSKILVTGLLLVLALTSCDNSTVFSDSYRIGNDEWSMYDPARFSCSIDDTIKTCDISFSLRTSTGYPYRNMYLFIVTTFPSGTTVTDTLNATVTDEKGRWQGKGAGDLRELTVPYKSNVFFPEKGEYHFRVIHGMRDTLLKGVYDIGMKISLRDDQQK